MALGSGPLWLYVRRQWCGSRRRHGSMARSMEGKNGAKMDVRRDFDSDSTKALRQLLSTCTGVHQILRSVGVPPRILQSLRPPRFHGYSFRVSLVGSHLLCSANTRV